ncbi:MAG: acyltransferase [Candidatus Lokiarchaeota archaeon]|nr:acyltransferase [Candidatus Lokiarchaeota archaeon]
MIRRIAAKFEQLYAKTNSDRYINFLRKKGVRIGEDCQFFGIKELHIDLTQPSLIEIGNKVRITRGVMLLTHGYDWAVLRELYGEVIGRAGHILINDNVFIGTWAKIMPGVTINENSIIGVGSLVTKDVEANSVVAGVPAKKIYTIEEYYNVRKQRYIEEAKNYARSIKRNLGRMPTPEDFPEFFPLFLERNEGKFGKIPVRYQTRDKFNDFMKSEPLYRNFKEFIEASFNEIQ